MPLRNNEYTEKARQTEGNPHQVSNLPQQEKNE